MSNSQAIELMLDFGRRTGLTGEREPERYLWTDAFAVCNYLGLARATGEARFMELATRLVDQVHHVLGRHRADDPRSGWISGLDEDAGEAQPTRGGLRIGKPLPERSASEAFDERLEWERDGQYFHYLTKWMHALERLARASGDRLALRWARELARAAHDGFVHEAPGHPRPVVVWKMSIDLARPQVPSVGQHDPLDGYVTVEQLRASAAALGVADEPPRLKRERDSFQAMLAGGDWTTPDPLGIGGLLIDAARLARLTAAGAPAAAGLLETLLRSAARGLTLYAGSGQLDQPAERRLAFRELGLAIGLQGIEQLAAGDPPPAGLEALQAHRPLAERIAAFWADSGHRQQRSWTEHRHINAVMLATALAPAGFYG